MRFARRVLIGVGGALTILLHATPAAGQVSARTILRAPASGHVADGVPLYNVPAGTSVDVLKEMASRAAVIFVGTVTGLQKPSDPTMQSAAGAAVVEVDFAVERGVRGVAAGQVYAMREWAGLWRDTPRFVVGQRLLMLLHGPGPGGLSSPVDGLDGAIPIRGGGQTATVALASATVNALADVQVEQTAAAAAANDAVDMRWLLAKTMRVQAYADAPVADPGVAVVGSLAGTSASVVDPAPASNGTASLGTASIGTASEGLTRVLGLLALWQETRSASN